ncbi:NAD-dependent epimerase/dehydratase family protein [Pseudooceanicola nanhaiensis]|uniref:NAD-dependent epimerase/dehydratase family protein n=1 Tax=Pseudooceanicola nanhaiensis TaxID=375761 RepID=UPI001CD35232|nr:NAD-dependent epimerase/dehydratase family protein [Pseudooceanicola nanhaiensis]MCA0919159.1 NAD-dependent epimerase/dehydratase family protein [Pseudooceanicola nanhaiensis]
MRTVLVTGSAGFIGFHISRRLLDEGFRVVGVDAHTDMGDADLKRDREAQLRAHPAYRGLRAKIETPGLLLDLFASEQPEIVIHLAAQAGVRQSISDPRSYLDANIIGTYELLEAARAHPPAHMLLASSSSVYGANSEIPYSESERTDTQMSFYAATKKATENMAHSYAHLFGLPVTMFRFFTVYGPWGRPNMAMSIFTRAILRGEPIDVFNNGEMRRDFTYIADLCEALRRLIDLPPARLDDAAEAERLGLSPVAPYRVLNIGHSAPVPLTEFIAAIETATGRTAQRNLLPMQPGDVPVTWADSTLLHQVTGYRPDTDVPEGVAAFVEWYRAYYGL